MKTLLSRRDLLRIMAGSVGVALLEGCDGPDSGSVAVPASLSQQLDFAGAGSGEGWGGHWICPGVANLRRQSGQGVLEAGSDIFPNDPRPIAFALDSRALNARIRATLVAVGSSAGVVLRRRSPCEYYAAIHDTDLQQLRILRRVGTELQVLAGVPLLPAAAPGLLPGTRAMLELSATGSSPTLLQARLTGADGQDYAVSVLDDSEPLQQAGEAGVLARADTLLAASSPVLPALGNLHLLPYSVQEGQAVIATPAGAAFIELIRQRSTARFGEISIESVEPLQATPASIIAATTGAPLPGGAMLQVACDLPAEILIDISHTPDFTGARVIRGGRTGAFDALACTATGLDSGIVYWRARARRGALETTGPVRSFRVLPPPGSPDRLTFAYGACASQFSAIFDQIAARKPDAFIWQGDLNYPDTHGPFAQTPDKTLLGMAQRSWLLEGLSASTAPFKVICSPNTLAPAPGANARDGSWAAGFTAERDLLLSHIRANVPGQVVFLSGDTHFTMVWDRDGLFEQRACPLDIPQPNDQSISNPLLELNFGSTPGVAYWSRRSHFSCITVEGQAAQAVMTVELVREDGAVVHSRRFEAG
jgi:hypothetical protein